MATFPFELVSPEKLLFSGEVTGVVVPGAEGEFEVLAGHSPMMTTLKPGVLTVSEPSGNRRLFVRGGFADVTANGLSVLAEQAIALEDVNIDTLTQQIRDAEEDLRDAKDEKAKTAAADTLEGLRALLSAKAH